MKAVRLIIVSAMIINFGSFQGYAQEDARVPETAPVAAAPAKDDKPSLERDDWQFYVAPYMWLVGNNINLSKQGTRGATAAVDIPWYDYVPDYFTKVFGAMGRVEIWKGRWGLFVDNVYLYVSDNVNGSASKKINNTNLPVPVTLIASGDLKIIVRQGFLDVGGRYLLGILPLRTEKPWPFLSGELLGGVRYNWYNQTGDFGVTATLAGPAGGQVTKGKNFDLSFNYMVVEPFLGLRTGFWLTEKLNILFRADIGGFGMVAYQDFNANLEALLGYKVHDRIRLYAGYRGHYYSFNLGSDSIKSFGWYHGPVVGAVFSF